MNTTRLCILPFFFLLVQSFIGYAATGVYHTATLVPPGYTSGKQDTNWADSYLLQTQPGLRQGDNILVELSSNARITVYFEDFHDDYPNILLGRLNLYFIGCDVQTTLTWQAYLLSNQWDESFVTWTNRVAAVQWHTPGGDYAGTPATNGTVQCTAEGYHTFDITTLLAAWNQAWEAYNGILLTTKDPLGAAPLYIAKDNGTNDVNQQPFLVVIPEPGVIEFIMTIIICRIRWFRR